MTFHELTRMMLTSMDFFELRRTAARYSIQFQGVRRQKLIRDIERKIVAKASPKELLHPDATAVQTIASTSPEGAMLARPNLSESKKPLGGTRINTFSARNSVPRAESVK